MIGDARKNVSVPKAQIRVKHLQRKEGHQRLLTVHQKPGRRRDSFLLTASGKNAFC